jgi:O-antigen/teichoic acid export membrane protein
MALPRPLASTARLASKPMSTAQRVVRNTAVLIASNISSFVLGFFFTMYVARHLGADGFGVLSFGLAFTAIFGMFADIGLQTLMIREIARDKALAAKYLGNVAVMKLLLVVLTFGLMALVINVLDYPPQTVNVVYLLGLATVLNAFSLMFYGVFFAYERMEFQALGQVLAGAITLAGAFWAISHDYSVAAFAMFYTIASVVTLGYSFAISAWKFTLPRIEVDSGFWKRTFKEAWPFGLAALFAAFFYYIDSVMLSVIKGEEAVGWYSAAHRLLSALMVIPMAYFSAIFPIMSRLHITSKELQRFTYERSFKYMLMLGVPIGVGTTILANKIIVLIFGLGYVNSIIALQILVWSIVFGFVSGVFTQSFASANKQIVVTIVVTICAVLNVILDVILIPRYGVTGASFSALAAQSLVFVIYYVWGLRIGYGIPIKKVLEIAARVLIASAIMCVLILAFKNFYILALVPLSALLYFAVLYIIGGIDRDDLDLLKQIIRKQPADDVPKGNGRAG